MNDTTIAIHRCVLVVMVASAISCMLACNDSSDSGPYPDYALCETSMDCGELLPECRRIQTGESGMEVSICTRDCSVDRECPNEGTVEFQSYGHCVEINEEGQLDAEVYNGSVCIPNDRCNLAGVGCIIPGEITRPGRCAPFLRDSTVNGPLACLDAPPFYNHCESDADCSPDSPLCRRLDLDDAVDPVTICVRKCATESDASCKFIPTDPRAYQGQCLGIDEQGKPDPDADEILCLPGCPFLENSGLLGCFIGAGISGVRAGSCGFVEYKDGFDPVPVCIEGKEGGP